MFLGFTTLKSTITWKGFLMSESLERRGHQGNWNSQCQGADRGVWAVCPLAASVGFRERWGLARPSGQFGQAGSLTHTWEGHRNGGMCGDWMQRLSPGQSQLSGNHGVKIRRTPVKETSWAVPSQLGFALSLSFSRLAFLELSHGVDFVALETVWSYGKK